MNEFEYIAHSTEFPSTSVHEVASAIGISKVRVKKIVVSLF